MTNLLNDVFEISNDYGNHQSTKSTENTQFSYPLGEYGVTALKLTLHEYVILMLFCALDYDDSFG